MQDTSFITNYNEIIAEGDYNLEWAIDIGEQGRLITRQGERITFGSGAGLVGILISTSGAESGFGENMIKSVNITQSMFSGAPVIGKCISAEIDIEMLNPEMIIPRMAMVRAFCRIFNDTKKSGWIDKGTFYIDTREIIKDFQDQDIIRIHGYDKMLMTEQPYVWKLTAGATDVQVVNDIVSQLQWSADQRTYDIMTKGYTIDTEQIGQYTMREVLGYIATMYAGCFIVSPQNELRLVQLVTVPFETSILSMEKAGALHHLTFGSGEGLVKIII